MDFRNLAKKALSANQKILFPVFIRVLFTICSMFLLLQFKLDRSTGEKTWNNSMEMHLN